MKYWQEVSTLYNYNEETGNLEQIVYTFLVLWRRYRATLTMFQWKPLFILDELTDGQCLFKINEKDYSVSPMDNHWDEVSQSLFDDCMEWVFSHK